METVTLPRSIARQSVCHPCAFHQFCNQNSSRSYSTLRTTYYSTEEEIQSRDLDHGLALYAHIEIVCI
jgi:hypothetical protein